MTTSGKDFGEAIKAVMNGGKAQRAGWNGKGMFIYFLQVPPMNVPGIVPDGEVVSFAPCFCLFTAQGTHQPGWNAAQPDMQAQDWQII